MVSVELEFTRGVSTQREDIVWIIPSTVTRLPAVIYKMVALFTFGIGVWNLPYAPLTERTVCVTPGGREGVELIPIPVTGAKDFLASVT